jgi:hypothetical protein
MDEVIAKIGPEENIEIVEHHSGKVRSRLFVTPEDGAYLARGLLACAAALCGPDPPPAGTIFADAHIPALEWVAETSDGGFLLTIKIRSGIELSFQMPAQTDHLEIAASHKR